MQLEWKEIAGEESRTYTFPTGAVTINGVTKICVRPSGNHRLETADNQKWIIPEGWIALRINAREWSL